jgi:hypothetical protein
MGFCSVRFAAAWFGVAKIVVGNFCTSGWQHNEWKCSEVQQIWTNASYEVDMSKLTEEICAPESACRGYHNQMLRDCAEVETLQEKIQGIQTMRKNLCWCEDFFYEEKKSKCPEYLKEDQQKPFDKTIFLEELCGPSSCRQLHDKVMTNCTNSTNPGIKGLIAGFPFHIARECSNPSSASAGCESAFASAEHTSKCPEVTKESKKEAYDKNMFNEEICGPSSCRNHHDKILSDCPHLKEFVTTERNKICKGANANQATKLRGGFPLAIAIVATAGAH